MTQIVVFQLEMLWSLQCALVLRDAPQFVAALARTPTLADVEDGGHLRRAWADGTGARSTRRNAPQARCVSDWKWSLGGLQDRCGPLSLV